MPRTPVPAQSSPKLKVALPLKGRVGSCRQHPGSDADSVLSSNRAAEVFVC